MKANNSELTIVVPVFNEDKIITSTATKINEYCILNNWRAIFVNDGSRDNTRSMLESIKPNPLVTILHHKINRGYGGAIKTGIRNTQTEYVVTIDADGQHNLEDIRKLFELAIEENADLIVGNRGASGDVNAYRALGKRIIRTFASFLMPLPVQDLNSGFKLYRTELAKKYIKICPDTMAFSDVITLAFVKQRDLILEQKIKVNTRTAGESKINTYTAFDTIMEILNIAVLFNPLRVFLPISFFSILFGLLWGASRLIFVGEGISVGAMLAIVSGIIFFVLGLLANQISALRMQQLND